MAEAGHLRPVGDEPGRDWHDWNCQLGPDAIAPGGERGLRHNPNHGEDGKFTSGHGHGGGHFGAQPYEGQVNPPTPHGASTAAGHDIKAEVIALGNYAHYRGDVIHGVAIPALNDKQRASIGGRIDRLATPPRGHPHPERWKGRDEDDAIYHATRHAGEAFEMHQAVTGKDHHADVHDALTSDRREGRANARGLAYARGVVDAIDHKVKAGEIVRTFEDTGLYAATRLRLAHVGASASPSAETSP